MPPRTGSSVNSMSLGTNERFINASKSCTTTSKASRLSTPTNTARTTDLANSFKSDLSSIRNLVTCSICDQLLYEPWTIACGHTYCYSCLCNWFGQNRRKKSCPECRSKVRVMPAPSFLVKQLVEVFLKRVELMPVDETIEQHQQRRAEEVADVDRDKQSPQGLFKGLFTERRGRLWRDEADHVLRCSGCGHEHEGGSHCDNCGEEFPEDEAYNLSDFPLVEASDDDLLDIEAEIAVGDDFALGQHHGIYRYQDVAEQLGINFHHTGDNTHFYHESVIDDASDDTEVDGELSSPDADYDSEDDSEDDGSMHDFVVPDDEEPDSRPRRRATTSPRGSSVGSREPHSINISDDESDEGGAISNGRQRNRVRAYAVDHRAQSPTTSLMTVTDASTNGSESGDPEGEAEMLRHAGWSPLDQGNDSDVDSRLLSARYRRYVSTEDGQDSDDDSDTNTETMIRAQASYADDDDDDDDGGDSGGGCGSQAPYHSPSGLYRDDYRTDRYGQYNQQVWLDSPDEESSDYGHLQRIDGEGDTDMSASPRASNNDRNASVSSSNPYGHEMTGDPPRSPESSASVHEIPRRRPWNTRINAAVESRRQTIVDSIQRSNDCDSSQDRTPRYRRRRQGGRVVPENSIESDATLRRAMPNHEVSDLMPGATSDSYHRGECLGVANQVNDVGDESSDASVQPAFRRNRRGNSSRHANRYDPRISLIFAEHQQSLRSIREDRFSQEPETRRVEPASRNRRMTAYRYMSSRSVDPLRSPMSPSTGRVVATSSRTARSTRQSVTRNYH